jgi:MFS family permease
MTNKIKRMGPFLWHGAFLALTMAMIEPNTVLPALLSELSDNTAVFGVAYSILLGAPLVFNLWFSRLQQGFARKKKFLLIGIYVRTGSFVGLAAVTLFSSFLGSVTTLGLFLALVFLFSISGGFAGIAYTDMIGKTIPNTERGQLYAWRQIVGGVAGLAGALVVGYLFSPKNLVFPLNYTFGLLIGAAGLFVGAFGFWAIREPEPASVTGEKPKAFLKDVANILGKDRRFLLFVILENVTALSLMVLPFYMVFLKRTFPEATASLGLYVFAQMAGALSSNVLWAFVSKRFGSKFVMRLCIGLGASLPLLAWGLSLTGPAWFTLLFFLVGFVVSGRNVGFEPYLLEIAPAPQRTLYLGIRGTLNVLLVFLPLAGGLFIQVFGFVPTFLLVTLGMTAAFSLTFFGERADESR